MKKDELKWIIILQIIGGIVGLIIGYCLITFGII